MRNFRHQKTDQLKIFLFFTVLLFLMKVLSHVLIEGNLHPEQSRTSGPTLGSRAVKRPCPLPTAWLLHENKPAADSKKVTAGKPLVAQWFGLHTFTAKGPGSILGQGIKIPQAMGPQNKMQTERRSLLWPFYYLAPGHKLWKQVQWLLPIKTYRL